MYSTADWTRAGKLLLNASQLDLALNPDLDLSDFRGVTSFVMTFDPHIFQVIKTGVKRRITRVNSVTASPGYKFTVLGL